jgi:hypothetical protein
VTPIAGRCARCELEVWRFVEHPKTGERIALWPRPSSLYPVFATEHGEVRGIAFCASCCPAVNDRGPTEVMAGMWDGPKRLATVPVSVGHCLAVQTARERYDYWYSDTFGTWLRAWLKDELNVDLIKSGLLEEIVAEWNIDRSAPEVKAAGGAVNERERD